MKATKLARNRKAVSPVIATVILVSVTIVVAVAVAYWMGGIAGLYTAFEKVEILSSVAIKDTDLGQWNITVELKNSGSADATINSVRINGKTLGNTTADYYNGTSGLPADGLMIKAGQVNQLVVTLVFFDETYAENNPLSGTDIEVKLHTAAGLDYPDWVKLP